MALFDTYSTDKHKSEDGVWIVADVDDDGNEMRFLVSHASATNKKLVRVQARISKPYQRQISNNSLSEKISDKLARDTFIEGILLGWENVVVRKGEPPLEYNKTNAEMLFTELPELMQLLMLQAMDFSNFKNEGLKEAGKNSQPFSPIS